MSFVNVDDVIEVNEGFVKKAFKDILEIEFNQPFMRSPQEAG